MNEQLKIKIKAASEKIDALVNFAKIASKIKNKPVRIVVSSFELVDGYVFRVAMTEVIDLIPDKAHPVVEAWLDAFIQGDYILLVDKTGGFLATLNLIPLVETNDEKNMYVAILTALVRLIPQVSLPEAA